jgi:hypothetical protein
VSPRLRLTALLLVLAALAIAPAQTPQSTPGAGVFGGGLSSGPWTPYVPANTNMTSVTSLGAFNQIGKTVLFRFVVTGTSNGTAPHLGLPVPVLNQATLLQTASCVWTNDSAVWVGAYANPNIDATNSFGVFQYNQVAPGTAIAHTYVCGGSYEAQ